MPYKLFTSLKRRLRHQEEGFSLIETLFAMVFLSIGLLAMAQMIPLATSQIVSSQSHTLATETAQDILSILDELPFGDNDLSVGTHSGTRGKQSTSYTVQDDVPVPGAKRIDLSVSWEEASGTQIVTFNTILRP
jgi:Tfp pilus assembly protein PilV